MEKLKILVTGAAGFIGFHLSKKLLNNNYDVVGIDNLNDYYDVNLKKNRLNILEKYNNFEFKLLDISDKYKLENIFKLQKFDVVINLAAQAGVRYSIDHPDEYIKSNIIGFYNILECCRKYMPKHLLFASSSSVYGNNKKVPYEESDKVDMPVSLYAATKKTDELLAYSYSNLYDIPSTGLRFFTVYGPYGRPDMAYFSFSNKIMNDETIKVFNNGDMYRDFTYIDDIVKGIYKLIDHIPKEDEFGVKYKIFNIGNNKPVKIMDFINILERCLGKEAKKEFLPMQPGDVYETYASVDELKKEIEFSPNTTIEEGLNMFAKWYKNYYMGE